MSVALGELLIDFTAQGAGADGYPPMAAHPGGARHPRGHRAARRQDGAFGASVGADAFGSAHRDAARESADTRGVVVAEDAFTTLASVTPDARGERPFLARKLGRTRNPA